MDVQAELDPELPEFVPVGPCRVADAPVRACPDALRGAGPSGRP